MHDIEVRYWTKVIMNELMVGVQNPRLSVRIPETNRTVYVNTYNPRAKYAHFAKHGNWPPHQGRRGTHA